MHSSGRSARRPLTALLLFVVAGAAPGACGQAEELPEDLAAAKMFEAAMRSPDRTSYDSFTVANRRAAYRDTDQHDRGGVLRQVRFAEATAACAVHTKDADLAIEVLEQVAKLREQGLLGDYDQALPGAKARFLAAETAAKGIAASANPKLELYR